ncbi:MAG: NUDIX domain-containing protein [Bifidobacteriaceae bacterium]|jgi:8-oxo-dGTP diphosphatase|nr:NUDIX domain-containing protein [Bifidobacteriaceae bacterium]
MGESKQLARPRSATAGLDAAGGLVWRVNDGRLEVLLVHRPRYDDWSWPKGKLKAGEDLITCAWREVLEETGRQVVIGRPLPKVAYPLASGRIKTVYYWAARLADDADNPAICARPAVAVASQREVDRTRWLPVGQALRRLTRPTDRVPLLKLRQHFERGRLETRPVVVLRHAQAVPRGGWAKPDSQRPLTDGGGTTARCEVPLLAALGVRQVISSPWLRCRATVRLFANRARLAVTTSRWLTETDAAERPERARGLMSRVLKGGPPVVICSHRPVLPLLFDVVGQRATSQVHRSLAAGPLAAGEAAIAHTAHTASGKVKVVALDRIRPATT